MSAERQLQRPLRDPAGGAAVVARVQFVDVSIAPVTTIRKLVSDAIKNTALVIDEPGEVVLRGRDPEGRAAGEGAGGSG